MKKVNWTQLIGNVLVIGLTGYQIYQSIKNSKTDEAVGEIVDVVNKIVPKPNA